MKKITVLFFSLFAVLLLAACGGGTILEDEGHAYFVTGNFAGWGDAIGLEDFRMEAIALNDDRVSSIRSDLRGATALYIFEATFPTTEAGWGPTYTVNGVSTFFDGNLTVKVVRTSAADTDIPLWWGPSPESGEIRNLTTDTLFMPKFIDDGSPDFDPEAGTGHWNDNPVVLEAGTYHIIFAVINGQRYMGAIKQ